MFTRTPEITSRDLVLMPHRHHFRHLFLKHFSFAALPIPTFYEVCRQPWTESDGFPPKLDGLAMKFVLNSANYDQLYVAVTNLLHCSVNQDAVSSAEPGPLEDSKQPAKVKLTVIGNIWFCWVVVGKGQMGSFR